MTETQAQDPEGPFAPIHEERDQDSLAVTGEIPRGLAGTLFRIGPNPLFPSPDPMHSHLFVGDGMVHAFRLQDGRAAYANRWVRTDKFLAEQAAGHALPYVSEGVADTGVANTNIVWHAGRLLALEEGHLPWEIDPATLGTKGVQDFGRLSSPFTAHPKTDPATGELVFFGYNADNEIGTAMSWGSIAPDGRVTRLERFDAPLPSMVHDFAITAEHVLFPVMPLVGNAAFAEQALIPYAWMPELGGFVGVMRRDAGVASLRWFRAEACFVFHLLNAWDERGRIVADVIQYDAPPLFPRADGTPSPPEQTASRLVRWTIDPAGDTDAFRRAELDPMRGEFPRIDERRTGLPNRYGMYVGKSGPDAGLDTLLWLDLQQGGRSSFGVPAGDTLSEAVFVPRGAEEGDGWILATAGRAETRRSELLILDAADISRGPVATIHLPHRVPAGFHGNWLAQA